MSVAFAVRRYEARVSLALDHLDFMACIADPAAVSCNYRVTRPYARRLYRRIAFLCHPDRAGNSKRTHLFRAAVEAYERGDLRALHWLDWEVFQSFGAQWSPESRLTFLLSKYAAVMITLSLFTRARRTDALRQRGRNLPTELHAATVIGGSDQIVP